MTHDSIQMYYACIQVCRNTYLYRYPVHVNIYIYMYTPTCNIHAYVIHICTHIKTCAYLHLCPYGLLSVSLVNLVLMVSDKQLEGIRMLYRILQTCPGPSRPGLRTWLQRGLRPTGRKRRPGLPRPQPRGPLQGPATSHSAIVNVLVALLRPIAMNTMQLLPIFVLLLVTYCPVLIPIPITIATRATLLPTVTISLSVY